MRSASWSNWPTSAARSSARYERTRPAIECDLTERSLHLCGEEIPNAGHICAFFDSRADKYKVLAPYLAEGIEQGDRIINVVDAEERDQHVETLAHFRVDVRDAMQRRQFQLLTA